MYRFAIDVRRFPAAVCLSLALAAMPAAAQWSQTHDQFYFPAKHNWQFRHNYPAADRLFNAFDYGHAILYERLYNDPDAPVSALEQKEYNFITRELLVHPPRVPLEEGAIEVNYAKIAPEAKAMFDWAHVLHRQVYDVWADERIAMAEKDARVADLLRYYKSRKDLAYSSVPKSMVLMEGQYYSRAFRDSYPKFNGLIWAYHWLQVGLYEPLVTGKSVDERQTGVIAAVARFKQMLENAPESMPRLMPMTAAIAPEFAKRYPEPAIIFDNLHAMHDVISDILASPKVPRNKKREEILRAARRYRDDTSFAITEREWREMSRMMGVENMGGSAVAVLRPLPTPSADVGAGHGAMNMGDSSKAGGKSADMPNMAGMDHSKMGMGTGQDTTRRGEAKKAMPGMPADTNMAMPDHAAMNHTASPTAKADSSGPHMQGMMQMHMRMMADPVMRKRMLADTAMRRMMDAMMASMSPEHRAEMERMMANPDSGDTTTRPAAPRRSAAPASDAGHASHGGTPATKSARPTPKPASTKAPKPKPAKDSMPAMDHSKMPGMKKP